MYTVRSFNQRLNSGLSVIYLALSKVYSSWAKISCIFVKSNLKVLQHELFKRGTYLCVYITSILKLCEKEGM